MRFVKTLPLLLSLGATLGSVSAWALPSDRDQPIRVQADSAEPVSYTHLTLPTILLV